MAASEEAPPADGLPGIPDFTLLKAIGRGAYGEVWLGRSLTGAFRAIKIVRRDRFERQEAFDREFRGIRNYEKVSRSHPGLLDVLHVGRLGSPELYYYVMELADAESTGKPIDLEWNDYVPRTLAVLLKHRKPLPPREAATIGARLAEALDALHRSGLIHRDIKPSNIVFVAGRPKLADVGLVAAQGQGTCVGTLGYLAPEGPGSPSADIYSLGKVLYEISSGRDRLDFPKMPAAFESLPDKEIWRPLNALACHACHPSPRHRPASAATLASELATLGTGGHSTGGLSRRLLVVGAIAAVVLAGTLFYLNRPIPTPSPSSSRNPAPPAAGSVKVISDPPGAQVLRGEELLGATPLVIPDVPSGPIELDLVKAGYRTVKLKDRVTAGEQTLLGGEMGVWRPPILGELWKNGVGMRFLPSGEEHLSAEPVAPAAWQEAIGYTPENLTAVPFAEAERFCTALTERDRRSGYLGPIQRYRPAAEGDFTAAKLSPPSELLTQSDRPGLFHVVVETIPHGTLRLTSDPEGAEVFLDGHALGSTPLTLESLPTGPIEFVLKKSGFETATLKGLVSDGRTLDLAARLTRSRMLVFGRPWENSLGVKFVPLGEGLMLAVWETRVRDYATFLADHAELAPPVADFPQTPDDPAIHISRDDAVAFCQWLTDRERESGFLPPAASYRLPTDAEWSRAAGLPDEPGHSPAARDGQVKSVFPWDGGWPPPKGAGNFADNSPPPSNRMLKTISRYEDGYAQTAPAGSFAPNALGLYDLAGNVWEWVADDYGGTGAFAQWAVLRGGSWANAQPELLWTSYRNLVKPAMREPIFGFRVAISLTPAKPADPPLSEP